MTSGSPGSTAMTMTPAAVQKKSRYRIIVGVSATPSLMLNADRREEEEHQRQQLRHLVAHVRHDLVVDAPADLDGVHERPEVVVGEDHPSGLLGHLAAAAHGHADVGLLEGGRVVHGVAGHRDDQALLLHGPREAQLVLRRDAAEHVQLREARDELLVGERLQLGAADRPGPRPERGRSPAAVTALSPVIMRTSMPARSAVGTAPWPRRAAGRSCRPARRTRGRGRAPSVARAMVASSSSSTNRAANARTRRPSAAIRSFAAGMPASASAMGTCDPLIGPPDTEQRARTTSGPPLTSMMTRSVPSSGDPVERRHELVVGVERHLREPRVRTACLVGVDAELGREHDEGRLRRVADDVAVIGDGRVAVEHEARARAG